MESTIDRIRRQKGQTREAYEEVDRLLDLGANLNSAAAIQVASIGQNLKLILSSQNTATA